MLLQLQEMLHGCHIARAPAAAAGSHARLSVNAHVRAAAEWMLCRWSSRVQLNRAGLACCCFACECELPSTHLATVFRPTAGGMRHRSSLASANSSRAAAGMAGVCAAPAGGRAPPTVLHLAWAGYKKQLAKNPLRTKALTSACVASLSDVIAQRLIGAKYNPLRTLKMALWGLCIGAPSAHYWHAFLAKWFAGKSDTMETAIHKVLLDQLTFGPLYNLCFMAYTSMVVHGMSPAAFQLKLTNEFPALQRNGWKVWLPVGLINYRFVPLQFRVLFANIIALFWSTFVILSSRSAPATRVLVKRA